MQTQQTNFWSGDFGKEYTDRNTLENFQKWDEWYINNFGISRLDMFEKMFEKIDKSAKILEVGCNTGQQLIALQKMGFENLYGIELQSYAVEKSKVISKGLNIIQGSAFDIPFKDNYFDLVMTNGVLIHISPDDINKAISEIVRCSSKYISGFEYYADESQEVKYRGNEGYLWKMNYSKQYQIVFPDLKVIKEIKYPYIINSELGNIDNFFLLEK